MALIIHIDNKASNPQLPAMPNPVRSARIPRRSAVTAGAAAALGLLASPRDAAAFAEDVCYARRGGPLASCTPLPPVCQPAGTETAACKTAMVEVVARSRIRFDGGRSTIHSDVTYLLAQAVGLSSTDAYWIAAYEEATDLGSFDPRDNNSMIVGPVSRRAPPHSDAYCPHVRLTVRKIASQQSTRSGELTHRWCHSPRS